jgi:aminobenzoyl-glutamate utilization protein B
MKARPTIARGLLASLAAALVVTAALAQEPTRHRQLIDLIDQNAARFSAISRSIWEYAELGYLEEKSSSLLQRELQAAGFSIRSGVAGEPTAFVATYGQGEPVIGIMGEFDALPGLSQDTVPTRKPLVAQSPGHACGHNLLGSGAALAAIALKQFMERNRVSGTLRYYGTPAEEGGDGKAI